MKFYIDSSNNIIRFELLSQIKQGCIEIVDNKEDANFKVYIITNNSNINELKMITDYHNSFVFINYKSLSIINSKELLDIQNHLLDKGVKIFDNLNKLAIFINMIISTL